MKKIISIPKSLQIIFRSASGFVFGQGLYNIFILSLSYLIINHEIKDNVTELFVFSRLVSVISLLGFEKFLLKISPKLQSLNLKECLYRNKNHFKNSLLVFALLLVLIFVLGITSKENIIILLLSCPIISLNEILIYVFRGKRFYILNQFLQFGLIVSLFTIINLTNINYTYTFLISVYISLLVTCLIFKFSFKKENFKNDIKEIEQLIPSKFRINVTLGTLMVLLLNGADLFFYKIFFSTNSHDYIVISRLAFISTIPLFIMNNHFVADIASYLKTNKEKFKRSYFKNRFFSFSGSLLIVLILVFFNKLIYSIINIGVDYRSFQIIITLLLFAQLTSSLTGGVGNILMLGGKENIFMKNNLFLLSVSLIIYGILIPTYNLLGLAISNSILIIIQNIINRLSVKKYFNV